MNEKIRKICGHAGWFALGGLVLVCFSMLATAWNRGLGR